MKHCPLTDSLQDKSNPNMYFSSGRKVPKAHRGGQSVHEGVAAPDPPYPICLSAHCRGAALITPRGGEVSSLGEALARHHIQHASSTGSLVWGSCPNAGDFASAAASRRLHVAARLSRAVTPARGKLKFQPPRMGVERAEGPSRGIQRGSAPLVASADAKSC